MRSKLRRRRATEKFILQMADEGLIDVDTAATKYLFVARTRVHDYIKDGRLSVAKKARRRFWLRRDFVILFAKSKASWKSEG